MNHLSMEQLLQLQGPATVPGVGDARAHVASCPSCQAERLPPHAGGEIRRRHVNRRGRPRSAGRDSVRGGLVLQAQGTRIWVHGDAIQVDRGDLVAQVPEALMEHRPRRDGLSGPGLGDQHEGATAPLQHRRMNEVQVASSCLDFDGEITVEKPQKLRLVERAAGELAVTADDVSGRAGSWTDDLVPERAASFRGGVRCAP